jgi:hypothetical protein
MCMLEKKVLLRPSLASWLAWSEAGCEFSGLCRQGHYQRLLSMLFNSHCIFLA